MYMVTYSVFDALEKEGKVRIVATATKERLPNRPDIPAIGESVKRLRNQRLVRICGAGRHPGRDPRQDPPTMSPKFCAMPQFVETFIKPQSYIAGNLSRSEFSALLKAEHDKWAELVRISGTKASQ